MQKGAVEWDAGGEKLLVDMGLWWPRNWEEGNARLLRSHTPGGQVEMRGLWSNSCHSDQL